MPNELLRGTRRNGDFFDTYEETPEVKVTLERSGVGISVTVAWSRPDVPYASWFMSGHILSPEAESQPEPKPVPKRVLFHDSYGSVLLIRCWARGYHANFLGPGSGTLWARAAIMDVSEDKEFDRPHALRTDISGLREWLGITSWEERVNFESGRPEVTLTSLPASTLKVGEHNKVTLSFDAYWELPPQKGEDRRELLDRLHCTTRSVDPLDWDAHMQAHRAIRDLLVVSRWRTESCVPVAALREDDPLTTMDGTIHGEQWRKVVVADDEREVSPNAYHPHLLQYRDLGLDGINRWMVLRDRFARALDPVITSIDLGKTSPHTRLAHTGPGLEALGYLLMIRDGMTNEQAAKATLRTRLERILVGIGDSLPFDDSSWVDRTVTNYNALKHANRTLPDDVEVMNSWAECVLVVRAWVALELNVPPDVLKSRLKDDNQPRHYIKPA